MNRAMRRGVVINGTALRAKIIPAIGPARSGVDHEGEWFHGGRNAQTCQGSLAEIQAYRIRMLASWDRMLIRATASVLRVSATHRMIAIVSALNNRRWRPPHHRRMENHGHLDSGGFGNVQGGHGVLRLTYSPGWIYACLDQYGKEPIMATVSLDEAEVSLHNLLEQVEAGEEVTIVRHGETVAKLVSVPKRKWGQREFGSMKGLIKLDDSFFDPLPDEELAAWEGA